MNAIRRQDLVPRLVPADQLPHLPEGELENSPGWSEAQSWESSPTLALAPRRGGTNDRSALHRRGTRRNAAQLRGARLAVGSRSQQRRAAFQNHAHRHVDQQLTKPPLVGK